jgi:NYN domain
MTNQVTIATDNGSCIKRFAEVRPLHHSPDSNLFIVDGTYLYYLLKQEAINAPQVIRNFAGATAHILYYLHAHGEVNQDLSSLIAHGITPKVVDPTWNSKGKPKSLAPIILTDLLLTAENFRQVVLVTANSEYAPAITTLNRRGRTRVSVAAYLHYPISDALLQSVGTVIDLSKPFTLKNYAH